MARTYDELISLVRNWSNRDTEVLNDSIIQDCVRYAADKAYRHLRIAPLEHTVTYTQGLSAASSSSTNRFSSVTELAVPADLIEFIQIRGIDSAGRTTRLFNEKADIRTFNDYYAEKYSDLAIWTRQGNCILIAPAIGNAGTNFGSTGVRTEEGIELYYYRRLPALNARYDVNLENYNTRDGNGNSLLVDSSGNPIAAPTTTATMISEIPSGAQGAYVPNWLRDENERVILMGALAEVYAYLQEDDQAAKYAQLFIQEIQELNNEDNMRNASGGNVQMNFNGRGLI